MTVWLPSRKGMAYRLPLWHVENNFALVWKSAHVGSILLCICKFVRTLQTFGSFTKRYML